MSRACPWAHRTIIGRRLKGLEDAVGMSVVDPIRDDAGWAFTGGVFVDDVNAFELLGEAYAATDPAFAGRFSVPVLWDKADRRIVNNESGDILRMLDTAFDPLATTDVELAPEALRDELDELNACLYERVNNAVYQAGSTTNQAAYEEAVTGIFDALDQMDERLADRRFRFGDRPLETDWRLFTTLGRFDAVYAVHFKCDLQRITEYGHLWPYVRDLSLVALQPRADFGAPHGRDQLAS